MIIRCSAITCVFNEECYCKAKEIELIDFEYYKDLNDYEKDYLEDDMKCITYKRN